MALLTFILLPPEPRQPRVATHTATHAVIWSPSVFGMLGFIALAMGGTELMYIAQPSWATERFQASLIVLGTASLVYGVGELIGAVGSTLFTDRLGKRRAALLGFSFTALAFVALPVFGVSWPAYLAMYLLLGACVEFAIVASLTLASTVSVVGRATVMALVIAMMQVSRALASRLGVPLLDVASLYGNAALAALLTLLGVLIAWRFVREAERT
jgi:predicted MFS family arabinose efflux permease